MEKKQVKYSSDNPPPNYKEYLWYKEHEVELMKRYFGRYIVIKDKQVIGDYGTWKLARQQTVKDHKPGTFIIQHCEQPDPRWAPRLSGRNFLGIYGK